ncbi:MAG TPA: hypothetical protein VIE86_06405 [Nitrososphaera sp.]
MEFVDGDGNIVVPKSVRPIIDLKETPFGGKKGAKKQFRYGNLHIRDYDTHYTVHMDRIDPMRNPLGHLLVDAPEYLAGAAAAALVGRRVGAEVYRRRKIEGTRRAAVVDAAVAGCIAGSAAGRLAYDATIALKKKRGE